MQPGDHQVLVVARVGDDRGVRPSSARQVLEQAAELDPQLVAVGRVVELRARDRALAVDGVEVERRRARVRRVSRLGRHAQRRGRVEGDVVVDELAEERRPCRVRRVVRVVRAQARIGDQQHSAPCSDRPSRRASPPGLPEVGERCLGPRRSQGRTPAASGRCRPNVVGLVDDRRASRRPRRRADDARQGHRAGADSGTLEKDSPVVAGRLLIYGGHSESLTRSAKQAESQPGSRRPPRTGSNRSRSPGRLPPSRRP